MNHVNCGMLKMLMGQEQLGQPSATPMASDFGTISPMIHLSHGEISEKWTSMTKIIEHRPCCRPQMSMKLIRAKMYLFLLMAPGPISLPEFMSKATLLMLLSMPLDGVGYPIPIPMEEAEAKKLCREICCVSH